MVPTKRVLIEYDGPFHHSPEYWRYPTEAEAEQAYETQQMRDAVKDQWATENGWSLLRLSKPRTIEEDLRKAGMLPERDLA